jgi:hypothetical protein
MSDVEGTYIAKRIKTIFNIKTQTIDEYLDDIKYEIIKIYDSQYLMKQTNLVSGSVVNLMFFKSNKGYLSSSDNGIDNMFYNKCGELVHNWSIPIDSDNKLVNSHSILYKI